ncbi:MAG: DUF374 domain-containing protein [Gemmatimonadales bacterium]|nr:MAG: DUF374 domain-containing protein [Gemmatimonadales bacterium]
MDRGSEEATGATAAESGRGLLEVLGSGLLWFLGWSWRFDLHGREHFQSFREEGRPVIFLFWHSRILPLAHLHRNEGAVVLISRHRDGELIARLVERRGFRTVRGSSSRGGARGLRGLLRALREGSDLAITPDGPRGPARRLKAGPLLAAQRSGAPLILVGAGARRAWRVKSWDRFLVPWPFARVEVRYGPPIFVERDLDPRELEAVAAHVDAELNLLTDRVDRANPDPVRPAGPWTPPE